MQLFLHISGMGLQSHFQCPCRVTAYQALTSWGLTILDFAACRIDMGALIQTHVPIKSRFDLREELVCGSSLLLTMLIAITIGYKTFKLLSCFLSQPSDSFTEQRNQTSTQQRKGPNMQMQRSAFIFSLASGAKVC